MLTEAPTTGLPQLSFTVTMEFRSLLFLLNEYVILVTLDWVAAHPTVIRTLELRLYRPNPWMKP